MATDEEILRVLKEHVPETIDALLAIQADAPRPRAYDALAAAAASFVEPRETYILREFLDPKNLRDAFVQAMAARGVAIASEPTMEAEYLSFEAERVLGRAKAFRCRVEAGAPVVSQGSGCLVSPHLVMTASHVVKRPPSEGGGLIEPVQVTLSDGSTRRVIGEPVYLSDCSEADYGGHWPQDDGPYADLNDVALLRLETAEGAKFGYAAIPSEHESLGSRQMMLVHFPEGEDIRGVSIGRTRTIPGLTARVRHSASAAAGSSGGGCFGLSSGRLIGIHQGRWGSRRRLVPAARFGDSVRQAVSEDIAPLALWSLTGTSDGCLIFGRDALFEAFAEASRPTTRARGLRMLRADPDAADGMALNLEIVRRLIQLRPNRASLIHIPLNQSEFDLLGVIRRQCALAGLDVPEPVAGPGVADGETTPEASVRDRAFQLAGALNGIADEAQIWLYIDERSAPSERDRIALEMLFEAAFTQPALRLILAGCEDVSTPGETFETPGMAIGPGSTGLIDVSVGPFQSRDVQLAIVRARLDLGLEERPAAAVVALADDVVLAGIQAFNGRYSLNNYLKVEDGLRALLWPIEAQAAA